MTGVECPSPWRFNNTEAFWLSHPPFGIREKASHISVSIAPDCVVIRYALCIGVFTMNIIEFAIEKSLDPDRPLNHRLSFVLMDGERDATHEMIHALTKRHLTSDLFLFSALFTPDDHAERTYIFEIAINSIGKCSITQRQDLAKHPSPGLLWFPDILESNQLMTADVSRALRFLITESYPSQPLPSPQTSVEANGGKRENSNHDVFIENYNRSADLNDDIANESNASNGISALIEAYKEAKREGRITGWD